MVTNKMLIFFLLINLLLNLSIGKLIPIKDNINNNKNNNNNHAVLDHPASNFNLRELDESNAESSICSSTDLARYGLGNLGHCFSFPTQIDNVALPFCAYTTNGTYIDLYTKKITGYRFSESGLGVTNDPNGQYEITSGTFAQLDTSFISQLSILQMSFSSVSNGEMYSIYGSQVQGVQGLSLMIGSNLNVNIPDFSSYKYISVSASNAFAPKANILIKSIQLGCDRSKVPSMSPSALPSVYSSPSPSILPSSIGSVSSTVGSTVASTVSSTVGSTVASTVSSTVGSTVASTVASTVLSTVSSTVGSTVASTVASTVLSSVSSTVGSTVASTVVSTVLSSVSSTLTLTEPLKPPIAQSIPSISPTVQSTDSSGGSTFTCVEPVPPESFPSLFLATFQVTQQLSSTSSTQFTDLTAQNAFIQTVQCALGGAFSIGRVNVSISQFTDLPSVKHMRTSLRVESTDQTKPNMMKQDISQVQLQYTVYFLFPPPITANLQSYFGNLTTQLSASVTDQLFTQALRSFSGGSLSTVQTVIIPQYAGPFVDSISPPLPASSSPVPGTSTGSNSSTALPITSAIAIIVGALAGFICLSMISSYGYVLYQRRKAAREAAMEKWQLDSEAECSVLKSARAYQTRSYCNSVVEDDALMGDCDDDGSYSPSRYSPDFRQHSPGLRSSPSIGDRGWDRFSDTPGNADIYSDYLNRDEDLPDESGKSTNGWGLNQLEPHNEYDDINETGEASVFEEFVRNAMQYDDKSPSNNAIRKSPPQRITMLRISPSRGYFNRSQTSSASASVMQPSAKGRVQTSQAISVPSMKSLPSETSSPSSRSAYIVQSTTKISELRERLKSSLLASPENQNSDSDHRRNALSMSVRSDLTRGTNTGGEGMSPKVHFPPDL